MAAIPDLTRHTGAIQRIHTAPFPGDLPFMDIAAKFAGLAGTVVLMSGGDLDCARYHILAVNPWLVLKSRATESIFSFPGENQQADLVVQTDPLDVLKALVSQYSLAPTSVSGGRTGNGLPGPVAAGLFGYLSYDLKGFIEALPRTCIDDLGLPLLCMYAPSAILVEDKTTGERRLHIPVREKNGRSSFQADHDAFFNCLNAPAGPDASAATPAGSSPPVKSPLASNNESPSSSTGRDPFSGPGFTTDARGFASSFSRDAYMAAVKKVKDYIVSGHIYQVNLSQRFEGAFYGSPFAMFKTLFEKAPAPFYAYVNAGDHRIVSTSPERFVQRTGRRVETRPIKGTRPRGNTEERDRANAEALLQSRKDDAELSMIVDLLRNDLGRVCEGGSVRVADHRRLEAYRNVFHLVSVIEGTLMAGKDSVDLVRAAFPGGSITGCPRIRAMEIIDELEPCRRQLYTGSIGYIGFHDTMDLSIAIRTATIANGRIYFSVGGGVVYDSDPADEYEETLHKGSSIMGLFESHGGPAGGAHAMAWFNGQMVPGADVRLNAADKGVMYGYGFFETIRVKNGEPAYLDAHVDRFNRAWRALFEAPEPDLTWPDIVWQVITENRLESGLARVKIAAFCRDDGESEPFSASIVVTAAPVRHRLDVLQKTGLDLVVYPHGRQTPLADHKTLNYLYYYLAGKWAKKKGANEAVILNPDGSVSETNTANIICIRGKEAVLPASDYVLPGIMGRQAAAHLADKGYTVIKQKVMVEDLPGFDAILLTNALMGVVPAISLDGKPLRSEPGICLRMNTALLG